MVVISGQVANHLIGTDAFQEMDSSKMVSYEAKIPKDIEVLIKTIKKHF